MLRPWLDTTSWSGVVQSLSRDDGIGKFRFGVSLVLGGRLATLNCSFAHQRAIFSRLTFIQNVSRERLLCLCQYASEVLYFVGIIISKKWAAFVACFWNKNVIGPLHQTATTSCQVVIHMDDASTTEPTAKINRTVCVSEPQEEQKNNS